MCLHHKSKYKSVSVAFPKVFNLKTNFLLLRLCVPPIPEYVHLYPFWDLLRLLSSNPISSNPTLPPPPATCSHTYKCSQVAYILSFRPAAIHVVGLLLSLLWIHTHKAPWTRVPQDYTQ